MSKTRMGKRVASLLLSLVMMLSLLPTTVYATGDTGETKNEIVGQATTSGDNTEGTGEPEPTGEGEDGSANVTEGEDNAATNDAVVEETIAPVNAEGVDAVANAENSGDEQPDGADNVTSSAVAKIGDKECATLDDAIKAVQNGEIIEVNAGEYKLNGSLTYTDKAFTIAAAKDADVSFDMSAAVALHGAKITFNGVTFNYKTNNDYTGIQHADTLVYDNCTINGKVFLYAASETFNNCKFVQKAVDYNVWTYGAQNVAFNGCIFNCAGKAVLVYNEGAIAKTDLTVTDTKFIASAPVEGKAAIEIDTSLMKDGTTITIDAATVAEGFAEGSNSKNSLWNDKVNETVADNKDITVIVNNETVYAPKATASAVAKIGNTEYATLQAAFDAAKDGDIVTLLADATEDVIINKNITLDLGGKTLTNTSTGKATISVSNGATATVKNGSVVGGTSFYTIQNNGTATLEDVTATAGNTGSSMLDNWGTLTITSGTYTGGLDTVKSEEGSVLTINGGKFISDYAPKYDISGVVMAYGTTTINGGEFIQNSTTTGSRVIVTGIMEGYTSITYVKGGSFTSKGGAIFHGIGKATSDNFEVSGGTFNKSVSDNFFKEGYFAQKNTDGTYGVGGPAVAKVNSAEGYNTLAEAIAAAKAGDTVTLLQNVTVDKPISVDKAITLDLGGKTLTSTWAMPSDASGADRYALVNNAKMTLTNGTFAAGQARAIGAYAGLTLNNVTVSQTLTGGHACVAFCKAGATYTIKSSTITGDYAVANFANNATISITNSTKLNGTTCGLYHNGSNYGLKLTVTNTTINGSLDGTIGNENDPSGVYISGNASHGTMQKATFTNCTIKGATAIEVKYTDLTLNKCTVEATVKTPSYDKNNNGMTALGFAVVSTDNSKDGVTPVPAGTVTIKGKGNYTGPVGLGSLESVKTEYPDFKDETIKVSGGTFSSEVPAEYCADGYIPTKNEDGSYGVREANYVAQVLNKNGNPVGVKYETLQEAITAAGRKTTVKLLADTKENVTISTPYLTLDLNGFTLNGSTGERKPALTITARVTVMDSSEAKTGTIMREDTAENSGVSSHYVIDVQGDGWLTFEGGNVKNNSGNTKGKGASLVRVGDDSVAKYPGLNIKGGTFTQDNFIAIKVDRGTLYLNDGKVNSANSYAIENWHYATIRGGTVNGDVSSWTYSGGQNSDLSIEGGTVNGNVESVSYDGAEGKLAKVKITGGTVNGTLSTKRYDNVTAPSKGMATIEITGGTFKNDPTEYVVESSKVTKNADGTYGVAKAYLARIGETFYYTMEDAFQAQTNDDTIVLLRDYTTGGTFNSGSINRTVDLNGHTWTCTGTDANSAAFEINYPNASLTVKNGKIVSSQLVGLIPSAMGGTITYDNSSLTFENVEMSTTATSGIETNGNNANDTVTLKNSTLNVPNGFGIYFPSSGTLTINNSTINAKTMGVQVCAGSLDISGEKTAITATAIIEGDKTEGDGAIEDGAAISIRKREGYKDLGTITISGGTFTSNSHYTVINAFDMCNNKWLGGDATPVFNITGGTYRGLAPTNMGYLCADDFRYIQNADYYTVEQGQYEVKVTSRIWGTDQTVATPTGGGLFDFNDMAPVETYEVSGFNFKGWYWADENGNIGDEVYAGKSLRYVVNVLYDCTLIAVYEPITGGTFNLYVKASQFKVNGKLKYDCYDMSLKAAEKVKLEYTGTDPFLYWINSSNNVVSTEQTIELVMVGNYQLTAVVEKQNTVSDYAQVIFKNAFDGGQRLCVDWYSSDDTIRFPSTPVYVGRTFKYWGVQVNGEIVEATQTAISELIKNGAKTVTIAPVYESNGTYSVEVSYVDDMGTELSKAEKYEGIGTGLMKYVEAVDIPEYTFSCWKIGDEVVGTNKTYAALSRTDRDVVKLTAVYVKDGTTVTPMNVLTFAATGATIEGGKYAITFTANYSIGEAAAIAQGGILYWNTELSEDEFTVANGQLRKINWDKLTENFGARNGTVKNTTASVTIYARAYIVLENGTTIYSDIVHASYNDIAGK